MVLVQDHEGVSTLCAPRQAPQQCSIAASPAALRQVSTRHAFLPKEQSQRGRLLQVSLSVRRMAPRTLGRGQPQVVRGRVALLKAQHGLTLGLQSNWYQLVTPQRGLSLREWRKKRNSGGSS